MADDAASKGAAPGGAGGGKKPSFRNRRKIRKKKKGGDQEGQKNSKKKKRRRRIALALALTLSLMILPFIGTAVFVAAIFQSAAGASCGTPAGVVGNPPASGGGVVPRTWTGPRATSGLNGQPVITLEQWATWTLKFLAQGANAPEANAVTQEHITTLVAWAIAEGGSTANTAWYNPLNSTHRDADLQSAEGVSGTGVQAYADFDTGVEATARTIELSWYSRIHAALLDPSVTGESFFQNYLGDPNNPSFPGNKNWSADDAAGIPAHLSALARVRANYASTAGLNIVPSGGTGPTTGNGGGSGSGAGGANCSPDQTGIAPGFNDDGSVGAKAVDLALSKLHAPYASGAKGPDVFDCSGLVYWVYGQLGIQMGGSTATQIHDGVSVGHGPADYPHLLPGDIIILNHNGGDQPMNGGPDEHVGIFISYVNGVVTWVEAEGHARGVVVDTFTEDPSHIVDIRRIGCTDSAGNIVECQPAGAQ